MANPPSSPPPPPSSLPLLYRRVDGVDDNRGRRLVATTKIEQGRLIFVERPLLSLQTHGNAHDGAIVCRFCRSFVGGPDLALAVRSGTVTREGAYEYWRRLRGDDDDEKKGDDIARPGVDEEREERRRAHEIVPCRRNCGELYCSRHCEEESWVQRGHCLLCTGSIPERDGCGTSSGDGDDEGTDDRDDGDGDESSLHPLLRFKLHAVRNNEIFLMVGDLVATVVSIRARYLQLKKEQDDERRCDDATERRKQRRWRGVPDLTPDDDANHSIGRLLEPYLDFTLTPWWDVATKPLLGSPTALPEATRLDATLRRLCRESAMFLRDALLASAAVAAAAAAVDEVNGRNEGKNEGGAEEEEERWPCGIDPSCVEYAVRELDGELNVFRDELFFGKIVGSFEQNAIGIRSRHPLCRDALADERLRTERHGELVKCIERAGMIGEDDDEGDEKQDDGENEGDDDKGRDAGGKVTSIDAAGTVDDSGFGVSDDDREGRDGDDRTGSDYDAEEIAAFLAGLRIEGGHPGIYALRRGDVVDDDDEENDDDEYGSGAVEEGDDLDALFPPFDGTAMYSTACKMNHSCEPNVVAGYAFGWSGHGGNCSGAGWGRDHPLLLRCVALRDIAPGEELCISYVRSDDFLEKREEALANYGFVCDCEKCRREGKGPRSQVTKLGGDRNDDEVFGDDEDDPFGDGDDDEEDHVNNIGNVHSDDASCRPGHALLRNRVEGLDRMSNLCSLGGVPLFILGPAASFVVGVGSEALKNLNRCEENLRKRNKGNGDCAGPCLQKSIRAVHERNFSQCTSVGLSGERILLSMLRRDGAWSHISFREAYGCCAVTAAIGYAHGGDFLPALRLLDKASILGLPRYRVHGLFNYVEQHAAMSYHLGGSLQCTNQYCMVPDYREGDFKDTVAQEGLSAPIRYPMDEVDFSSIKADEFHVAGRLKPVVMRNYASKWRAIDKWRDLTYLASTVGHRIVPIEIGSMLTEEGMKERLVNFRDFTRLFLVPGCRTNGCWRLESSQNSKDSRKNAIAYMAQHQLFDQIPSLLGDINSSPSLFGKSDLIKNAWIGTGGTRTPLHYDSLDNLFVQIVGCKYIRIYEPEEANHLYMTKESDVFSAQSQGNMSKLDCEMEDFEKHPLAKSAKFSEALIMPGDCLFIPARWYHYVRSLTTSVSVNYWS